MYIFTVRFLNRKFIQSHVNFVILRSMFTFFIIAFMHEGLDFSSLRIIKKYTSIDFSRSPRHS